MDPQPSTSTERCLPPKRKRRSFVVSEKQMVLNAYNYVWNQNAAKSFDVPKKDECVKTVSEILGISIRSVYRILKEPKENVQLSKRKKSGPKLTFKDKIDDFDFSAIRRKVHQFFYAKDPPTIAKVHQVVNDDPDLPNMSKSTMRAVLKRLKFKYASRKRRSCLTDRQDLILWRRRYLTTIKEYRRQGKIIYYQDETWINEGHTTGKVWVDTTIESSKEAFSKGLTTGLKGPTGKGRRLIISHIGSDEGFVEAGLLMFESKKNCVDYHEEMNSECFEEWLKRILPNLKPNAVLVLDNAPYHSRKVERIPTSNWRKADIIQWLDEKQIQCQPTMIKAQLMEIVKLKKSYYERYAVEELAAEYGVTILRLPPYHCELNPIELVWAQAKGYVARNNKTFKIKDVKKIFEEGLKEVTPENWRQCINHAIKVQDKMCQLDHIIDEYVDSFVLYVNDSDSDSEYTDSELESESIATVMNKNV